MALLVKYRLQDGGIVGVWEANPVTHLDAQIDLEDTLHGYHVADTALPALTVLENCFMQDQEIQPKRHATLTATPNPFIANGDNECHVTVSPFLPCTVLVNGAAERLTAEDTTLILTTDTPQSFTVMLGPHARLWADPLTIEAR